MLNPDDLNETSRLFLDVLLAEFPDWTDFVEGLRPGDDSEAEPGSIRLVVPSPAHPGHSLAVALRGNFVEIAYSDGRPPGPAERLILVPDSEVAAAWAGGTEFCSKCDPRASARPA